MERDTNLGWHLVWWGALCLAVMWLTAQQVMVRTMHHGGKPPTTISPG